MADGPAAATAIVHTMLRAIAAGPHSGCLTVAAQRSERGCPWYLPPATTALPEVVSSDSVPVADIASLTEMQNRLRVRLLTSAVPAAGADAGWKPGTAPARGIDRGS
jgi:hypothetical protein